MTVLYIIGNGFDRWHGLPTSYGQFYAHAKATLDEIERYFSLDEIDRPWHDFESSLGTYYWRELFEEYDYTDTTLESFKVSETYGLQDELHERADDLHRAIEQCFCEWVEQIDVTAASVQMAFEPESRFISFNYTPTLQSIYGIDDRSILHIHGKADSGSVVFGHGVQIVEEPELDENGDSNRTMYTDAENAAKYPLFAFQKQTADVIQNYQDYLESLVGLSRIEVIGHSLAEVDLPYFREVARRNVGCNWIVYCYEESEIEHIKRQLKKCDVDVNMIVTRQYPNV
ncbi:MAG: bacteriophage abortive infection AbiH family protein [Rhodopirellula sp.]|nr:bacteriophage abortive infection AbiH family protein [Rhodopirellula sp.]